MRDRDLRAEYRRLKKAWKADVGMFDSFIAKGRNGEWPRLPASNGTSFAIGGLSPYERFCTSLLLFRESGIRGDRNWCYCEFSASRNSGNWKVTGLHATDACHPRSVYPCDVRTYFKSIIFDNRGAVNDTGEPTESTDADREIMKLSFASIEALRDCLVHHFHEDAMFAECRELLEWADRQARSKQMEWYVASKGHRYGMRFQRDTGNA